MPHGQIFRPRATTLARLVVYGALPVVAVVIGWAIAFARSPWVTGQDRIAPQPVPFSHEHHVGGLGIDCRYCHTSVETSAFAGLPSTGTCMTCHSQLWRNAALLAPVRESYRTGERLRWTRVHDLPDFVYFNHAIHIDRGVPCIECHGRVDRMPLMRQAKSLLMQWCLDCHRDPGSRAGATDVFASETTLHEPQAIPVIESSLAHPGDPLPRLLECSICHR